MADARRRQPPPPARVSSCAWPPGRPRGAVRRRGAARHAERRALRLRRRPARDQRARQLPAEHHHPPARPRRPGDRRVRHRAPRRHRLRRHGAGAAPGDHRHRGRRLRAALRPERLAHPRHRASRTCSTGERARRQHDHAAARAQAVPAGYMRAASSSDRDCGLERKIKEAIVAIQLEKRYTKREIFTFYANQINLGHGAYGVEAASRLYFDKPAKELTLEEAATIAAIIQTPARLSPFVDPEPDAARRSNYVLPRMADEGFITAGEARDAAGTPAGRRGPADAGAVDRAVLRRRDPQGARAASTAPTRSTRPACRCRRRSTPSCRRRPTRALDRGLRRIDKRRSGYRRAARNVVAEGHALERFTTDAGRGRSGRRHRPGGRRSRCPRGATGSARVRIGAHEVDLPRSGVRVDAADGRGGPVQGRRPHRGRGPHARTAACREIVAARAAAGRRGRAGRHRQPHRPDPRDGRRLQLRAQQVQPRDAGAPADGLDVQADRLHGRDRSRLHAGVGLHRRAGRATTAGPNQPPYSPLNYDRKFEGPVTLRRALEQSRNIPAVKAMAESARRQVVRLRRAVRLPGDVPAVPVAGARRGRSDARRGDERLLGVSRTRACG